MERALDRGVQVSLLVDGFGAYVPDEYFDAARRQGAGLVPIPSDFRPPLPHPQSPEAGAGRRADRVLIGGFNIEDSYFGPVEEGAWRDLGLLVEGPAAARLVPYYDELLRLGR